MHRFILACLLLSITSAFSQESYQTIQNFLNDNHQRYQLNFEDVQNFEITKAFDSKSLEGKHVYIQQTYQGEKIFNAIGSVFIKNGNVEVFNHSFIDGLADKITSSNVSIDAISAFYYAVDQLNLNIDQQVSIAQTLGANDYLLTNQGISNHKITARLTYQPVDNRKKIRLAWAISFYPLGGDNWWSVAIDAQNGSLIRKHNWIQECRFENKDSSDIQVVKDQYFMKLPLSNASATNGGYRVYPAPVESPNHGSRSLEVNPADATASPFGWHDTDGVDGPEHTITRGNNVLAREDRDANDTGGYSPDGGLNLQFDFPLDFNQPPEFYEDAAITNLFYWNNIIHDVFANYGFNEAAGNFQKTNYSGLGAGNDFVVADAQDGSGINNANFGTPPDGFNPQMQMYLWSPTGSPSDNFFINSPASLAASYLGVPASFGPSIPVTPITADLALVQDDNASASTNTLDGCDNITNASEINGKIAVIERGECTFVSKIEKAQNAGALAVIMINNVPGDPITMGGDSNVITIPSIMISLTEGSSIISELQNGTTLNATLVNNGPYRIDGDFDNGIIAHEYGHGISNRLTGGADQSDCLFNDEQMGEGWSDWLGLIVTMRADDLPEDPRGYGTYAISQPTDGNGIRPARYSTDMSINPATYGITNNENTISQPHGIGYVWASMLWDLTWALVDEYGFDPDLYNGTGGNNIAIQLVLDGMKLQSCNPGFIDGRDAILQADQILYNGANACLIWEVFAKRGLGFSANQGSSFDRSDQVEAFDLPVECNLGVNDIKSSHFEIHPNPADQIVNIQFSGSTVSEAKISIYSLDGRLMLQNKLDKIDEAKIQIGSLAKGIYILKMNVQNRSFTKKLIVQ
ncbi:MAG: T9SS-dependent M36 family metallopeptidase [Psychroflexus sp.]|nr:T9SS-dependent M36 family metallopeptidase [Psychroflexus sp.]MDR9447621.1 T9SS-dependent M36 family metallopeptidase [Psychroflexus sp.]